MFRKNLSHLLIGALLMSLCGIDYLRLLSPGYAP